MTDLAAETVELRVVVPADAFARLEPVLWLLSPGGLLTEDLACLGAGDLQADQMRVSAYVAPTEAEAAIATLRAELARLLVAAEVAVRPLQKQDWNAEWKRHYHPFDVGRRIRIEPAWELGPDVPDRIRIAIDPGLAFGTGTHETTRLALVAVERLADTGHGLRGMSVVDVGCGSAILAILACKLGASRAIGTEIDVDAVDAARLNLRLNGLEDRIRLELLSDPSKLAPERFDLAIANIISSVLLPLRDALVERVKPGGAIVLSGILQREIGDVRSHYLQRGLEVVAQGLDGEWASLVLRLSA
jgi:ribosomal protein L11 methyltransferase